MSLAIACSLVAYRLLQTAKSRKFALSISRLCVNSALLFEGLFMGVELHEKTAMQENNQIILIANYSALD